MSFFKKLLIALLIIFIILYIFVQYMEWGIKKQKELDSKIILSDKEKSTYKYLPPQWLENFYNKAKFYYIYYTSYISARYL